ncbi:MAG TPA: glycosyltransferase N-terminal domain-containing protein [Sphingobacteriaceae bacterium]
MVFLYDLGLLIYSLFIRLASLKNKKARKWLEGRKNLFRAVAGAVDTSERSIWFHFASLGEFEQGRPVLEQLKKKRPNSKVVITFFSPSGYEIRKDYALADHVFYLPLDTQKNASEFIRLINPEIAVFTKYEFWHHYFRTLHEKNIPLFLISAIFRKDQIFFKWYGSLQRKTLHYVSHFFTQTNDSKELLKSIGIFNATVAGDTRFDRVAENAQNAMYLPIFEAFGKGKRVFVGGSTWPEDEDLLRGLASKHPDWKFIVAPHEIQQARIEMIEQKFPSAIRYSRITESSQPIDEQTVIIDNIGMLASLYRYGNVAFIGGGFGAGIHNTLEAAAFGLPVIFGPKHEKFQEAKDLISVGGGFSVRDEHELAHCVTKLLENNNLEKAGTAAQQYVYSKTGATGIILSRILS